MNAPPLVLCVGDIDVDILIRVPSLPGFDDKVSGRRFAETPGGMAANAAVALSRLGVRSRLVGAIGDDEAGELTLQAIAKQAVDVDHVVRKRGTATFKCLVMLSPKGEKALIRLATDAYLPRADEIPDAAFEGVDHLHLTLGDPALTLHCLKQAARRGIATSLDLETADIPAHEATLRRVIAAVDLLFVNRRARDLLIERLGAAALGGKAVVTTLGREGSVYQAQDGAEPVSAPGVAVRVLDTTGAGDCFAAAFLSRRLEGAAPADALAFANAAAALSTRAYGAHAGLPTRREVVDLLNPGTGRLGGKHA